MNYTEILEAVKHEVTGFIQSNHQEGITYHTLSHTERVVKRATQLARFYELDDRDCFIVITAAWFHDTGYYVEDGSDHEDKGAEMATTFLQAKGMEESIIAHVRQCIMATFLPQQPIDLLGKIVADADLYHWGTNEFRKLNKRMRQEAEFRCGQKISASKWREGTIGLLESHHFHTDFAHENLQPVKEENLSRLKQKALKDLSPQAQPSSFPSLTSPAEYSFAEARQDSIVFNHTASPLEHSFPEARQDSIVFNHTATVPLVQDEQAKETTETKHHSQIFPALGVMQVDSARAQPEFKAVILLCTASLLLSVMLFILLRSLDEEYIHIAFVVMMLVCLVTVGMTLRSMRPVSETFTAERKTLLLRIAYNIYLVGFIVALLIIIAGFIIFGD